MRGLLNLQLSRMLRNFGSLVGHSPLCMQQYLLNISGASDDPTKLVGDALEYDSFMAYVHETKSHMVEANMHRFHLYALFWLGEYEKMVQLVEEVGAHTAEFEKAFLGTPMLVMLSCYVAVGDNAACTTTTKKRSFATTGWHTGKKKFGRLCLCASSLTSKVLNSVGTKQCLGLKTLHGVNVSNSFPVPCVE